MNHNIARKEILKALKTILRKGSKNIDYFHFENPNCYLDYIKAFRLLKIQYSAAGFLADSCFLLYNRSLFNPNSMFLTAKIKNEVLGTISCISDKALRMPCRHLFNKEIDLIFERSSNKFEVGTLSVNEKSELSGFNLYYKIMEYILFNSEIDCVFIQVPKHREILYVEKFCFELIKSGVIHPYYNMLKVSLLYLDAKKLRSLVFNDDEMKSLILNSMSNSHEQIQACSFGKILLDQHFNSNELNSILEYLSSAES